MSDPGARMGDDVTVRDLIAAATRTAFDADRLREAGREGEARAAYAEAASLTASALAVTPSGHVRTQNALINNTAWLRVKAGQYREAMQFASTQALTADSSLKPILHGVLQAALAALDVEDRR